MSRICFLQHARKGLTRGALAALLAAAVLSAGAATRASAAAHDIYVVNSGDNSVSVVDPTTNRIVATVPVGSSPRGVAVSPDGSQAWVTSEGDDTVSVISTATNTVTATIPVGGSPESVALSPDGTRAYVGLGSGRGIPGSIGVIDTSTDTVIASVTVGVAPEDIAVSSDGSRVYNVNAGGSVSVIDAATGTVIATITGSGLQFPLSITLSPDGTRAYVPDGSANLVFVIDTATNTITGSFSTAGAEPIDVSLTPDGARAYVATNDGVSVIDTATDTIIATIPIPADGLPLAILMSGDGTTAYTANAFTNDVSVIDTATNTVTYTIPVGNSPVDLGQAPTVPPPAIASINPNSGVLGGGTTVTITGTAFTGATAVSFGRTPATSFTVNSDTSITATAPPAAGVGSVDITVTTPAGTSSPVIRDQYAYLYPFSGFLPPVANRPTQNTEHAGQAIPIQFSLGGNYGLGILVSGTPLVQQVDCTTGSPIGSSTQAVTVGNSGLQYNTATGTYTFPWKTASSFAGTCQVFILVLNDNTHDTASFKFS